MVMKSAAMKRVYVLAKSYNLDIVSESLWVLANCVTITNDFSVRQEFFLAEERSCIKSMLEGLKLKNCKLVLSLLEALKKLL